MDVPNIALYISRFIADAINVKLLPRSFVVDHASHFQESSDDQSLSASHIEANVACYLGDKCSLNEPLPMLRSCAWASSVMNELVELVELHFCAYPSVKILLKDVSFALVLDQARRSTLSLASGTIKRVVTTVLFALVRGACSRTEIIGYTPSANCAQTIAKGWKRKTYLTQWDLPEEVLIFIVERVSSLSPPLRSQLVRESYRTHQNHPIGRELFTINLGMVASFRRVCRQFCTLVDDNALLEQASARRAMLSYGMRAEHDLVRQVVGNLTISPYRFDHDDSDVDEYYDSDRSYYDSDQDFREFQDFDGYGSF